MLVHSLLLGSKSKRTVGSPPSCAAGARLKERREHVLEQRLPVDKAITWLWQKDGWFYQANVQKMSKKGVCAISMSKLFSLIENWCQSSYTSSQI